MNVCFVNSSRMRNLNFVVQKPLEQMFRINVMVTLGNVNLFAFIFNFSRIFFVGCIGDLNHF